MRQLPATPRISDLAGRQYGVVSRAQLEDLGLTQSAIAWAMKEGRLHRLHRGVYAVGHTVLKAEGRWLAAVLASGPGAVLSHAAAAVLWELRASASARIDVTVASATTRRAPKGVVVHRTRRPIESTTRHGIPVTTPMRTLADLAGIIPPRALDKALEQAEALRLLDVRAIDDVADANPGRAGPALVRRLVRAHDLGTFTRSDLEAAFLALCRRHGLPPPTVNSYVERMEVDFSWPAHRLVAEVDGFRYHGTRAAFERDRARDATLTAAGWRVVRFTDRQVRRDAATVAQRLERLLAPQ
jgi:very-short-patch-repair endonuclease/predicted transcriptional regulator of viral defense system